MRKGLPQGERTAPPVLLQYDSGSSSSANRGSAVYPALRDRRAGSAPKGRAATTRAVSARFFIHKCAVSPVAGGVGGRARAQRRRGPVCSHHGPRRLRSGVAGRCQHAKRRQYKARAACAPGRHGKPLALDAQALYQRRGKAQGRMRARKACALVHSVGSASLVSVRPSSEL